MDPCSLILLKFSLNPEAFPDYLAYSGKGINELGDYNNCLKLSNSSYFMVSLYSSLLPPELSTFIGLCFASVCNEAAIQNFLPVMVQQLNITSLEGVDYYVRKSNGDEGNITIDHSSYIIIVVLFALLVLGLIHPLLEVLRSTKKPKPRNDEGKLDMENSSVATKEATITTQLLPNDKKKKTSRLEQFFECFSLHLNLKRLFSIREGPLDFFNGVRALSLLYVIFGHDYYLRSSSSQNPAYVLDFIRTPYFLIIGTAFYAVDVFFWLSGFFLAFVILDPQTKKHLKKPLTFAFAIFHRYCRIIPAYLVAICIYWKVICLTGSGPLWPNMIDRTSDCEYMWRNILFVENLFSMWGDMHYCFGWGWYLSNDFQLFIISLFLIFIYARNPVVGKITIWLTIAGTSAVGCWVCYTNSFKVFPYVLTGYSVSAFMNDYYYKPWCRAPPYLFGLFVGILYKEFINRTKECQANKDLRNDTFFNFLKIRMLKNATLRYSFYVIGLFIVFFFSFFARQIEIDNQSWSQNFIVFWLAFQRLFFVIGLTFVLLNSLIIGKDLIAKILAWSPFGFIANLNFCGYLVHYFIIERSFLGSRQTLYYNAESVLYMYFADLFFTLLIAGALSVFVELPFINLEKFIKGDKKKPAPQIQNPPKEETIIASIPAKEPTPNPNAFGTVVLVEEDTQNTTKKILAEE